MTQDENLALGILLDVVESKGIPNLDDDDKYRKTVIEAHKTMHSIWYSSQIDVFGSTPQPVTT